MQAAVKKKPQGLLEKLKKALFAEPDVQLPGGPAVVAPPGGVSYTSDQQRELEMLFSRLFTNQSLVTSGRLQMLGFEKIKAKLGDGWPLMQAAIYNIADEVIRTHKTDGDVYLRYKDDTYVLIFPHATVEEGWARASFIAEEIGKRLAQLGHDALRIIQIEPHVCALEGKAAAGQDLGGALESISKATAADLARARVSAASARQAARRPPTCLYHPIWNVKDRALSGYLCELEKKAGLSPLDRDLDTLRAAEAELPRLKSSGDASALFLPVRHGTLFNADSARKYISILEQMPDASRKKIHLVIVNYLEGLPQDRAFWFLAELKAVSGGVFVMMGLRTRANFAVLKAQGVDKLAVAIDSALDEAVIFTCLQNFTDMARAAGIQQVAGFNIPSLSLVTSSTCMGLSCLSGPAIHAGVRTPDRSLRFRYADIFTRTA